jgi:hypothetical protein
MDQDRVTTKSLDHKKAQGSKPSDCNADEAKLGRFNFETLSNSLIQAAMKPVKAAAFFELA